MAYSDAKIDLRGDGRIVLYQRTHLKKPKWQARISVPNATGYKVISTKTADFDEAKRFAANLYDKLCIQVLAGGALNTKTYKQVFEEWKIYATTVGTTRGGGSWASTIHRVETYALPFFGPKRIDQIKEGDFTDYWTWRKVNFNQKAPTNDTLRRERTSIMPVFKFALSKGYITQIPKTNAPKPKGGRRPTFTRAEWECLRKASLEWVQEAAGLATHRDRFMARFYFLVLAETGLRIGELRGLRWSDLFEVKEEDQDGRIATFMACRATGKTGEREVIFQHAAALCIHGVNAFRTGELALDDPAGKSQGPDKDEPIFCHPDGKPIREFKHSFSSLLRFAGIPVERNGRARTPYSFRHFYATERLSQETSPFLLAKQMGTSIEMLERHYGQVMTPTVANGTPTHMIYFRITPSTTVTCGRPSVQMRNYITLDSRHD